MPEINSTAFGEITVDNHSYHQVLIIGDRVVERDYERLTKTFGTSHRVGDWEVEELLAGEPEAIIVGTGVSGMLEVSPELLKKAKDKEIEVISNLTPEAIKVYNKKAGEGRRINALIHTTC